jgi:hypothetical protein
MNDTKVCPTCQEEKLLTEFYSRGKAENSRPASKCKSCFNSYCIKRWVDRKKAAIEYKGGKCADCNISYPYPVYDFHHLNPNEKDVQWNKLRLRSEEVIKQELDKCVLLCSNCHRLRHHNDS